MSSRLPNYRVRLWFSWLWEQYPPIFEGTLTECFRLYPMSQTEERDAVKALVERGEYFGGFGGEYTLRRVQVHDFGRASDLELARKLPWWLPERWLLFLRW